MNTRIEPIELTADSPRELTDTELDAVSGGAVAVGASSGAQTGGAVAGGGGVVSPVFLVQPGLLQIGPTAGPAAGVGVR
jgi:hypothetical protein